MDQAAVLVICLTLGGVGFLVLLGLPASRSLSDSPEPLLLEAFWGICMVTGGTLALASALIKDWPAGTVAEIGAQLCTATGVGCYLWVLLGDGWEGELVVAGLGLATVVHLTGRAMLMSRQGIFNQREGA